MNTGSLYPYLDLSATFFDNINKVAYQNNNEIKVNNYDKSHINPPFRYYNDDANLNLTSKIMPNINMTYKNKSMFVAEKPSQTEQDEIGINTQFLNNYYGYTDYGNYSSLRTNEIHKTTPKNNLYDRF